MDWVQSGQKFQTIITLGASTSNTLLWINHVRKFQPLSTHAHVDDTTMIINGFIAIDHDELNSDPYADL
jgi:hypothetical protein